MSKETGQPLFKETLAEWSTERLHFVAWLMFYDKVYNLPDGAPSQDIINDDALLDDWISNYNMKKVAERTGATNRKKSATDHKAVISFGRRDD